MTDTETWLPWPRNPRYRVSSHGQVQGPSGRILTSRVGTHGYLQLTLTVDGSTWGAHPLHRVVCETFHGPRPPGLDAAHEDGDEFNCRADNLTWKTRSDNMKDTVRHGRLGGAALRHGEGHHLAVLTEDVVRAIRAEYDGRRGSYKRLARKYNIHFNTVRQVVQRVTWKDVA